MREARLHCAVQEEADKGKGTEEEAGGGREEKRRERNREEEKGWG